jgi:GT2 family glycosyltransferase
VASRVSAVVVAYRSGAALARCLDSLERQRDVVEVIVVDNGAADDEIADAARRKLVRVVSPGRNLGFAGGCNAGAEPALGEVLAFLNPDTVVAPRAIDVLAGTLSDPSVGVAMARLRLLRDPDALNSDGNVLHLAGFAWAGGYGERVDGVGDPREVAFASGAALAIRTETFRELRGFTEMLFLYGEDLELAWRARLRGLRVVVNPRADVFHDYEFDRHADKRYYLERNRLIFVLSAFSGRLLVLLAPILCAAELATAALALREGWLRQKLAGWGWLARHARWLLRHRRKTQAERRVRDRELAVWLTPTLDPAMLAMPALAGPLNRVVEAYWRVARRAL